MQLTSFIIIGLGGFLGAISRYLFSLLFLSSPLFGMNTFFVNIIGSLIAGILITFLDVESNLRLFFIVGFLGSFTTFSAFSVDTLHIFLRKEYLYLAVYVLANVIISLIAVALGYSLSSRVIAIFK